MQIIIHAGLPKTGTTYLQHVFKKNIDVLRKNSILYTTLWHQFKNWEILDKQFSNNVFNTYIKIAESNNIEKLLLSEESLFTNIDFLKNNKLCKKHNIIIMLYIRLIPSQTERFIRQYFKTEFCFNNLCRDVLEKKIVFSKIFHWKNYIKKLTEIPNIEYKFFSYEKSKECGLETHFLSHLGLNINDFNCTIPKIERNISPSAYDGMFLNFIKALPMPGYEFIYIVNYFRVHSFSSDNRELLFLDKQYYKKLIKDNYTLFENIGKKMNYVDYIADSLRWLEGKDVCQHSEIPKEKFQEILENLPSMLQDTIVKYLPQHVQVYDGIKSCDTKEILPAYLSQASAASTSAYVTLDTMLDLAEKHPFDPSLYTQPLFFGKYLERYAYHLSSIKFNTKRTCFYMRNWAKTYRKLLCIELMRVFFERKYFHMFFDDRQYTNSYLTELLQRRINYLHECYVFDNIKRTEGKSVIFFGGGSIFFRYFPYFTTQNIVGICIDIGNYPKMINGIPVFHPDDILPRCSNLPIFIFSKDAPVIKNRIKEKYQYFHDIITCCF